METISTEKQLTPMQELIEWADKFNYNDDQYHAIQYVITKAQSLLPKEKQMIAGIAAQ